MKLVLIGISAALLCGSAVAQLPDAAQRAENRAKAAELLDKATPGPAERARNRAKAAELADKVTPDADQRARNRAKTAELADKATPDADQRAENRAKAGHVAHKAAAGAKHAGRATKRKAEAMGAGPAADSTYAEGDRGDSSRRERMDAAYSDWQRQQQGSR